MDEKAPMTMKDIAKEFGISVATVSRALKDSPRISEERRKAIQQYAREHNFYPNFIGAALRHNRVAKQDTFQVSVCENYVDDNNKQKPTNARELRKGLADFMFDGNSDFVGKYSKKATVRVKEE